MAGGINMYMPVVQKMLLLTSMLLNAACTQEMRPPAFFFDFCRKVEEQHDDVSVCIVLCA